MSDDRGKQQGSTIDWLARVPMSHGIYDMENLSFLSLRKNPDHKIMPITIDI